MNTIEFTSSTRTIGRIGGPCCVATHWEKETVGEEEPVERKLHGTVGLQIAV